MFVNRELPELRFPIVSQNCQLNNVIYSTSFMCFVHPLFTNISYLSDRGCKKDKTPLCVVDVCFDMIGDSCVFLATYYIDSCIDTCKYMSHLLQCCLGKLWISDKSILHLQVDISADIFNCSDDLHCISHFDMYEVTKRLVQ